MKEGIYVNGACPTLRERRVGRLFFSFADLLQLCVDNQNLHGLAALDVIVRCKIQADSVPVARAADDTLLDSPCKCVLSPCGDAVRYDD